MAKRKKSAARPKAKEKSLRYLVAHKVKDQPRRLNGSFAITPTLEEANSIESATPDKEDNDVRKAAAQSKRSFASIQSEIASAVARHRALATVMTLMDVASVDIQFSFAVKPIIDKHGTLVSESDDRNIYSFDASHARDVFGALRDAKSGVLGISQLPRLLLIGLVSEYDVFLHKLIRAGFAAQGGLIARIDRAVTLKDLEQFSSIQEASDFLVEREIDAILHDDHREQLITLNKLFNTQVDAKDDCVKNFLEICERRNLFTHNAGLVNRRYISKCKEFGVDISKVKVGEELRVSAAYFAQSITTIQELTIKLTQFIWRKLVPKERDLADMELNETAFQLLRGDNYKLAERILDYGINHTGKGKEQARLMMVVNYANAVKLGGDLERAVKILDDIDWSATSVEFQISVAAVRDDVERASILLAEAVAAGKIDETDVRTWPVFKGVRGIKAFQDKFKNIFKSELISAAQLSDDTQLVKGPETKTEEESARRNKSRGKQSVTRH